MTIVEMVVDSLRWSPAKQSWVLILKAKMAERYLPIYVGASQADIVRQELQDWSPPEHAAVDSYESEVKSVIIDRFDNNTFGAKLRVVSKAGTREIDCPPAAAVATALRDKAPVFVDELILDRAGIALGV
jgi:bifunctional DNase/RNase